MKLVIALLPIVVNSAATASMVKVPHPHLKGFRSQVETQNIKHSLILKTENFSWFKLSKSQSDSFTVNWVFNNFKVIDDPIVSIHEDKVFPLERNVYPHSRQQALNEDPLLEELWPYQYLQLNSVWKVQKGSSSFPIANIGTGVDYLHHDLHDNLYVNHIEIAGNNIDDDRNGYIDDRIGYNFAYNDSNPMDDNGHGTHTAGIHSAVLGNSIGLAGIAPHSSFIPIKFLDKNGSGSSSSAVESINYAISRGAKIIYNSWGGGGYNEAIYDALKEAHKKGILVVCSAGSGSQDNDVYPSYPASYKLPNIIAVASHTQNSKLRGSSNFGKETVHVAAPGSGVLSTFPGNEYRTFSGTSLSAAYVSGLLNLIWSQNPTLTHLQVRDILFSTSSGLEDQIAYGIISALKAVK